MEFDASIRTEPGGLEVARTSKTVRLATGTTELAADLNVDSPKLWSTWDRGGPTLYRADLEVRAAALAKPFNSSRRDRVSVAVIATTADETAAAQLPRGSVSIARP